MVTDETEFLMPDNTFSTVTVVVVVLTFLFLVSIFIYYIYVINNYDKYKSDANIFSFAWFFQEDPAKMFDDWMKQSQDDILNQKTSEITNNLAKADAMIQDISEKVKTSNSGEKKTSRDETVVSLQKNISNLKEALRKIAGSLVLNSYMIDGAIKTTKKFEASNAYKELSKV